MNSNRSKIGAGEKDYENMDQLRDSLKEQKNKNTVRPIASNLYIIAWSNQTNK